MRWLTEPLEAWLTERGRRAPEWLVDRLTGRWRLMDLLMSGSVGVLFFLFAGSIVGVLVGIAAVRPWTFLFSAIGAVFTWRSLRRTIALRDEWRELR